MHMCELVSTYGCSAFGFRCVRMARVREAEFFGENSFFFEVMMRS